MNKEEFIKIRVTEEEKNTIRDKASSAGLSVSEYSRRQLIKGKVINSYNLVALIREINYIGNNINQATKIMNMYHAYDGTDFNYIVDEFNKIKELIEDKIKDI
ncbi:MAG: plasmid mobilization relaxosome protein MobC [Oscillospiraceae bacterium]